MDLHGEPLRKHEIGNRTYIVADVEPLDVDGVRTVEVGTALWFVGFVALLPFYGPLQESGRLWWLWTCMAGLGLGLFGLEYCRRRRNARAAEATTSGGGGRAGGAGSGGSRGGGRRRLV